MVSLGKCTPGWTDGLLCFNSAAYRHLTSRSDGCVASGLYGSLHHQPSRRINAVEIRIDSTSDHHKDTLMNMSHKTAYCEDITENLSANGYLLNASLAVL